MKTKVLIISALGILFFVIAYLAAGIPTADFYKLYRAVRGIFYGHPLYEADGPYIVAPWGVLPLLPFALLPPVPAHGLYFATCLYLLVYVAWRLRASPLTILAFMLSPTAIGALLVGNLDPVVISGILFPPVVGLFVLLIKPQIGTGVALYYLIDSVRNRRILESIKTVSPVVTGYALGAVVFPIWFLRMINNPSNVWNRSLFPYAIPLGLLLLWAAVRNRNPYYGLASTAFLAPYLTFYSYLIVQVGLLHEDTERFVRRDVLQIVLTVFLWAIMLAFKL